MALIKQTGDMGHKDQSVCCALKRINALKVILGFGFVTTNRRLSSTDGFWEDDTVQRSTLGLK